MNINLVAQDIPLQTFIAWGDIENKKIHCNNKQLKIKYENTSN